MKKQSVNDHVLAVDLTNDEGLKVSVSVAQVKEVLFAARKRLAKDYTLKAVAGWLRKSR